MDERYLIIIWKFRNDQNCELGGNWKIEGGVTCKEIDVSQSKDKLLAIILPSTASNEETKKILNFAVCKLEDKKNHLVLLHNKPYTNMRKDMREELDKIINKIDFELFGGGPLVHPKLYGKLLRTDTCFQSEAFLEEIIKKDVFDEIWEEYSEKKKLIKLKSQVLKHCLPIVIDMQGLKECTEKGQDCDTKEYLKDILGSKNWENLEKISKGEYTRFPKQKEAIDKTKEQLKNFGVEISNQSITPKLVVEKANSADFNINKLFSKLTESFSENI
jgi:hypothetical protein